MSEDIEDLEPTFKIGTVRIAPIELNGALLWEVQIKAYYWRKQLYCIGTASPDCVKFIPFRTSSGKIMRSESKETALHMYKSYIEHLSSPTEIIDVY